MSNLLLDALPTAVEVGGCAYSIHSDFRTMIRFELLLSQSELSEIEQLMQALRSFFRDEIPSDLPKAAEALLWFYRCGKPWPNEPGGSRRSVAPVYSFAHDAEWIFAAFWKQYQIDLNQIECLHWWKFKALFQSLSEDTEFVKIMGYRAMEITGDMSQKQKEFYRKMKKQYQLPIPQKEQELLTAIDQALLNGGDLTGLL